MTTITNFLLSNFLDSKVQQKQRQEYEVPLWVVNGGRDKNIKALIQYMVNNCINTNKAVVRLDFGISVLRFCRDCDSRVFMETGLQVVMPNKDTPYFIITLSSAFRSNTEISIPVVMRALSNFTNYVKDHQPNQPKSSIALIIEGLEIIATEKDGAMNLQTFIKHIPSLNPIFKQITVFKHGEILLPEHEFALERISTCLTDLEHYDSISQKWLVKSTVRRLTGFSNQQKYTITTMKNTKLKVEKWVGNKTQQDTQSHKQMVSELGFVVKKNDQSSKTSELKKMIYPHLRMQEQNCKCNQKQCTTCTVENNDVEGLIILDDEQEDDDDIDV